MVNKAQQFTTISDIDNFFKNYDSSGFVDWFNKKISSDPLWGTPIKNQANWQKVWGNITLLFGRPTINLVEFLCINSIIINETGGNFTPLTESVGTSGHPGLAYAFDKITGTKKSYNTLSTNKTALQLFNDPLYIKAHSTKPLASILKNTTDNRWSGDIFPVGFSGNSNFETSVSGKYNGFVFEADFMKFRGRGYIQLTGREIYKLIIKYITNYTDSNSIILNAKNSWKSYTDLDSIATISTNQQWDDLFQKTDSIIANYACYVHSTLPGQYKNYSTINPNQSDINLNKSITNVGLGVSGASSYAKEFLQRVLLQLKVLDNSTVPTSGATASTPVQAPIPDEGRLATTGQDPNTQVNSNINGSLPIVTNIFKPTAKPSAIVFPMSGSST